MFDFRWKLRRKISKSVVNTVEANVSLKTERQTTHIINYLYRCIGIPIVAKVEIESKKYFKVENEINVRINEIQLKLRKSTYLCDYV